MTTIGIGIGIGFARSGRRAPWVPGDDPSALVWARGDDPGAIGPA